MMTKSASALGHFGLLLGLLAVILELNQIAVESSSIAGTGTGAFYAAVILWALAVVFVAIELYQTRRSP